MLYLQRNPKQIDHNLRQKLATTFAFFFFLIYFGCDTIFFFSFFFLFLLKQGLGAAWKRNYNTSVLRIPTCSLPGMDTFVSPSKPNFRVTSTRDPTPLISYTDSWTPTCSQNSLVSTAAGHTHEMRASVIMKTSDVTSSWPLTSDEGVPSLPPGHRNDRECLFSPSGPCGALKGATSKPLIYCNICLGCYFFTLLTIFQFFLTNREKFSSGSEPDASHDDAGIMSGHGATQL